MTRAFFPPMTMTTLIFVNDVVTPRSFIYNKIYTMEITPDMLALDICSGAVVITDPNSGEVKALVSYPQL